MILSLHPGRPARQAASPRNLCLLRVGACPELLGASNFSWFGLTLDLQSEVRRLSRPEIPTRSGLSTFNRLSFPSPSSPHLCALCVRRLPRLGRGGENSSSFRSSLIPRYLVTRHSPLTPLQSALPRPPSRKPFIIRTYKHPSDLRETKDL